MIGQSLLLLIASAMIQVVSAAEVAVYWGQNSAGGQDRLSTYCTNSPADIVLVSFINGFPDLEVNFSNQCGLTFESGLLHCPQIGEDIKYCQSLGKKVLISMGGASGSYGFSSEAEGTEFATTLWNKFGGGSDDERPFDDAVVDGFDFDIEHGAETGYVALATALRSYFADAPKTYYLGAAPQCPYPDATLNDLLTNVALDYSFIQFYNNYCNLGDNFNWADWADYAASVSPNKNIQLFLGLPGSAASAAGYTPANTVEKYLSDIHCGPNFGGFAIWDASSAWSNVDANGNNYAVQLKNLLNEADSCTISSSSSIATLDPTSSSVVTSTNALSSSAYYGNVTSSELTTSTNDATTFTTNFNTEIITVTCTKDVCHHSKPTDASTVYETSYGTEVVTVTCNKNVCHHVQPTDVVPEGTIYTTAYGTDVVTVTCTKDVCHHSKPTDVTPTVYTTAYGTEVVTVTCTKDVCHHSKPTEVTPEVTTLTTSYGTDVVTVTCTEDVCKEVTSAYVTPEATTYTTSSAADVTPEETTYTTVYGTQVVTVVCTEGYCQNDTPTTAAPSVAGESSPVVSSISTVYTYTPFNASNGTVPIYEGKATTSAKVAPLLAAVAAIIVCVF